MVFIEQTTFGNFIIEIIRFTVALFADALFTDQFDPLSSAR